MATDGKYLTLLQFKQFLLGTRTDPNNPNVFNQGVVNTPDDTILSDIIINAESAFELKTGAQFNQQTQTAVQPFINYVDGNGWLHLFAREAVPVTAVASITYRDIMFGSDTSWHTITWDAVNDILLPSYAATDTYARPESAHVQIWPAPTLPPRAVGQLLVKWTYTAGFSTVPQSLITLIARMAMYLYKLREMPAGKVINQPLGTMTVPSNYPPDIIAQIEAWKPKYG